MDRESGIRVALEDGEKQWERFRELIEQAQPPSKG